MTDLEALECIVVDLTPKAKEQLKNKLINDWSVSKDDK